MKVELLIFTRFKIFKYPRPCTFIHIMKYKCVIEGSVISIWKDTLTIFKPSKQYTKRNGGRKYIDC